MFGDSFNTTLFFCFFSAGHSFYYMREDGRAEQCETLIDNWENQDLNGNNVHVDKENNSSTADEPVPQRGCVGPNNNYSGVRVQSAEHSVESSERNSSDAVDLTEGVPEEKQDCSVEQCQTVINNSENQDLNGNNVQVDKEDNPPTADEIPQHSAESSERNCPDTDLTEKITHEQNNGQGPALAPVNDDLEDSKVQSGGAPPPTGHSQSESQSYPTRKIPISAETFSKHCTWPKIEEKGLPKKQKERLPFAITSVKWTEFHESKKLEQAEKLKKAAEREVMRKIEKEDLEALN